ncbi:MAG: N-acetylglucosamine kinase [Candidatus Zhuqueibacterota bacterium]
MNHYVIGVDGGGTKTELVLIDNSGNYIGRAKVGSSNYQAIGGEKLKEILLSGFSDLLKSTNVLSQKVDHVFLGLAGAGRESDRKEIKALFQNTEFQDKITVDSDAIVALAGAFGTAPGIIIISGTGAICFGKNSEGKVMRSGGWGYLLGDEGSGYYIGRKAIMAALKYFDGRGEKTRLRQVLEQHFNLQSIELIIPLVYQNKIDRVAIAQLAPMVFEQATKGDVVSDEIIRGTGRELGKLAKAVAEKLNFANEEIKVAFIGSIFKQKEMLINDISKELYELSWNVQITEPMFEPQFGAALMAMQQCKIPINDELLENLKNSIK